jgi:hypothetical protein
MPLADNRDLAQLMEIEKGFDAQAAREEASRCLNCGLICYHDVNAKKGLIQIEDAVNA